MKILFAAAEVAPFAKVGGLGDVAGSLPKELAKLGHDVRVILPAYGSINFSKHKTEDVLNSNAVLHLGGKVVPVSLKKTTLPESGVIVYFVENDEYFGSHSEIYPSEKDARFEQERFIAFGKAVLELIKAIDFKPDVINCNDWHTGNIPVFLKTLYSCSDFHKNISTVFSIHNLAYQGRYGAEILDFAGLNKNEVFNIDKLEFYGDVNWLKGGIVYSDQVTTVSKKYAEEIQTEEYGEKLEGVMKSVNFKLKGILNGVENALWSPETDREITSNYSAKNLSGKSKCKKFLQKSRNLPISKAPLIGIVSRLADQKGFDLIASIADELAGMDLQMIILGTGQKEYENLFEKLSATSKNIKAVIGFKAKMAKHIYAGTDMFLMPSKFEPCGLGQLIALKYGSIPIARATGGLADTIVDFNDKKERPSNGFLFEEYKAEKLLETIKAALKAYENKSEWEKLVKNAMNYDYGWENSAKEYEEVYSKAMKR